ncbi:hypothetical protein KOAAANKH_01316 [Brevundimonas sp. NIBR10]|nr:hypothetical protein KOAAANKH_01316 [Brevundimonas sp. NIBR10]
MSEPIRLFALFVDEISDKAWRGPLTAAGEAGGWDILTGPVSDWAKMTHRCLVLSDDPDWGLVIPADQSVVIMAGIPAPPPGKISDFEAKEAVAAASARLSKASMIIAQGGTFVSASSASLSLPHLGDAQRGEATLMVPFVKPCALSIYNHLPPRPGAAAIWPAESFWYNTADSLDGGPQELDLTGRARIIVNGPHIYLTPGLWRVTFEISVDPEGGVATLSFDWAHGDNKVTCNAVINESGRYKVELERRWTVAGPAQVIAIVKQPLFQGRFEMHDCKVEMIEA